ncbi:MAG: DegV family protein [Acidimicrobiia bacterium]
MGVRVVTDSACDLPDELVADHAIEIVPLKIRFGDEELVDREQLTTDEFWDRLERSPVLPQTAAPSAGAFEAAFRRLADDGASGIICINLSANLSATMQAAQVAAAAVGPDCAVAVVDSETVSMGLGNLVLSAARLAATGASLSEVVTDSESRRDRTRLYGALDTLEYLKKGGRVGNARAMLGSMLSIKPLLEVRDGVVEEAGRVRTRSKSLRALAEKARGGPVENVAVLHGRAPDLDQLLDLLEPVARRDDITTGVVGPVIGTHAGPGVIGITFQESEGSRPPSAPAPTRPSA